jgi:hypothetical protein
MLAFMAEHRRVAEGQLAAVVATSPVRIRDRLRRLEAGGYLTRDADFVSPGHTISRSGLVAVGSDLPVPEPTLGSFWHDVGTAGLWLAAWGGAFGPVRAVVAERRMRSYDEAAAGPEDLYAVRLGGLTERGRERRHYPDLVLVDRRGRRLALELELSHKGVARREAIIAGYGADRRLDGVVYLVQANASGRRIAKTIAGSARRMGVSERVRLRAVTPSHHEPAPARAAAMGRRSTHRPVALGR